VAFEVLEESISDGLKLFEVIAVLEADFPGVAAEEQYADGRVHPGSDLLHWTLPLRQFARVGSCLDGLNGSGDEWRPCVRRLRGLAAQRLDVPQRLKIQPYELAVKPDLPWCC
jgi:hypothetical protein